MARLDYGRASHLFVCTRFMAFVDLRLALVLVFDDLLAKWLLQNLYCRSLLASWRESSDSVRGYEGSASSHLQFLTVLARPQRSPSKYLYAQTVMPSHPQILPRFSSPRRPNFRLINYSIVLQLPHSKASWQASPRYCNTISHPHIPSCGGALGAPLPRPSNF
jgi:hypothetical protein